MNNYNIENLNETEKRRILNKKKYDAKSFAIKKALVVKRQLAGDNIKESTLIKYGLPIEAKPKPVRHPFKYPLDLIEEIFKSNKWLKNKDGLFLAHKRNISIFRRVLELIGFPLETHYDLKCVLAPFKIPANKIKMKNGIDNMMSKRWPQKEISPTSHKNFYGIINTLIKTDKNHHDGTIEHFFSQSDKTIFNSWMMDSIKNSAEFQRINSTYSSLKMDYDDLLIKYNEFKPIDDEDKYYKYIIGLYLLLPPQRSNWKNVNVVDEEGEYGNNFYIPSTKTLIIGDYKNDISIKNNSQVFNKVEISLDDGEINNLSPIFKPDFVIEQINNMNYKPGDYIIWHLKKNNPSDRSKPAGSNFFKKASARIFGDIHYKTILKMEDCEPVWETKIGLIDTTDMRKAVITKLYREPTFTIQKRSLLAKLMLHSTQVAQNVYNNINWCVN